MITNEWIKVQKNPINEANRKTTDEEAPSRGESNGVPYSLPRTDMPISFKVPRYGEKGEVFGGMLRPAQKIKNNSKTGKTTIMKPHFGNDNVYVAQIVGSDCERGGRGSQYYVDADCNPIEIEFTREDGTPTKEPIWLSRRTTDQRNDAGKQSDTNKRAKNIMAQQLEQDVIKRAAQEAMGDDEDPNVAPEKTIQHNQASAFSAYIMKRLSEKGIKVETNEDTQVVTSILNRIIDRVYKETPDKRDRSNKNVEGNETYVGKVRDVFRGNDFTTKDGFDTSKFDTMYIKYEDEDGDPSAAETRYQFVVHGTGKEYDIPNNDVDAFKRKHPNWEDKGEIKKIEDDLSEYTTVAEAIDMEIQFAIEDYEAENELKMKEHLLGGQSDKEMRDDIMDRKDILPSLPFNPDRRITRAYDSSPALNRFIDKIVGTNQEQIESLDENDKKSFESLITHLKTLHHMEFKDGYYVKFKGSKNYDREAQVYNPGGEEYGIFGAGWTKMSPDAQEELIEKAAMKNAMVYIHARIGEWFYEEKKSTKRDNTPEESTEIRSYIKNILTDETYADIIMKKYKVDNSTLKRIVSEMFGGDIQESLKRKKLNEDEEKEFIPNVDLSSGPTRKAKKGEQLYDYDSLKDDGDLTTNTLDKNSNRLFAYDSRGNLIKTNTSRGGANDGERALRNQIKKWLSLSVSDFTDMMHLKLEIKSQMLQSPLLEKDRKRIINRITQIQKDEFSHEQLPTEKIFKWLNNPKLAIMSSDKLDMLIRKELFGQNVQSTAPTKPAVAMTTTSLRDILDELDPNDTLDYDYIEGLSTAWCGGSDTKPLDVKTVKRVENAIKATLRSNEAEENHPDNDWDGEGEAPTIRDTSAELDDYISRNS